jgi:RNA polymerase sigma-70 factor (ECF subfamily)
VVAILDDEEITRLILSGDPEAYIRQIALRYNKLLWVVVGGVLKDVGTSEDIEECISDVYLSLWRKPKAFDTRKGTLKTFLAAVAKNKALDRYRQLTKSKIVELNEAVASNDDDLFEYIAKEEMYSELYDAIRALSEPDKEILVRRYFFDEKPAGIAQKTDLPLKEVENRLYRSKQKLRKMLGDS